MKNERLFEAIGELDETMLAETENTGEGCTRRMGWRVALIAAVVAGLAVTAGVAPLIRNALLGGKLETDDTAYFTPTDPTTGESHQEQRHEITLDVAFNEDAPKSIETYYITPEIPEEFKQYHGHIYKDAMCAQYGWIVEGTDRDIFFEQYAGGIVEPGDLVVSVYTRPGEVPKHGLKTIAGIQGYLIEKPTIESDYGERIFCWSDGDYLFKLQVPCDYSDEELEEMVACVQPVEDITPYLSTMTAGEVEKLFGTK